MGILQPVFRPLFSPIMRRTFRDGASGGASAPSLTAQVQALFYEALRNAYNVGLVFGSPSGRGHGVYATGPATFTMLSYEVAP